MTGLIVTSVPLWCGLPGCPVEGEHEYDEGTCYAASPWAAPVNLSGGPDS